MVGRVQGEIARAPRRARTADIQFTKLALYQLSYKGYAQAM